MGSRAADQSHLNIETVPNVYLLWWELRENESCANKRPGIIPGRANREDLRQSLCNPEHELLILQTFAIKYTLKSISF